MAHLGRAFTALCAVLSTLVSIQLVASPAAHADSSWSGTLTQAISHIPVAGEDRTGYSRDKFHLWIDADGDGCDTRAEVLIAEADDPPTVGSGCSLSGGRWYSYYDGVSHYDSGELDIDHLVPLAEAWDSGARAWTSDRREAYANDLGDSHTLVAVTASLNRQKGDQDVAEKSALQQVASGCTNSTITVTVVS